MAAVFCFLAGNVGVDLIEARLGSLGDRLGRLRRLACLFELPLLRADVCLEGLERCQQPLALCLMGLQGHLGLMPTDGQQQRLFARALLGLLLVG